MRDSFLEDLAHYGIKNVKVRDLIDPDMLEPEQILRSRYPLKIGEDVDEKNAKWVKAVKSRRYKNERYLLVPDEQEGGKLRLYGLECEAVPTAKLDAEIKEHMEPVIGGDEHRLKIIEMKNLNDAVTELMIFKLTHPAPPDLLMVLRRRAKDVRARRSHEQKATADRHHQIHPSQELRQRGQGDALEEGRRRKAHR